MTTTGSASSFTAPSDPQAAAGAALHLTIERFHCRLTLPQGGESAATVRDRLSHWVSRDLAQVCQSLLTTLPGDDQAVYRIRHLHLKLWIDWQGMSEAEMLRRWGALLARAVHQAMQQAAHQDTDQVRRWESPLQFVAALLRDLLDGRAWGCWYYEEFRPLMGLSTEAIALQFFTLRPSWIGPILTQMVSGGYSERLLHRLSPSQRETLWHSLERSVHPSLAEPVPGIEAIGDSARLDALLRLYPRLPQSADASRGQRLGLRLRLWLLWLSHHPDSPVDGPLLHQIDVLIDLAALLRDIPAIAPLLAMQSGLYPALQQAIAQGEWADSLDWLVPLCQTDAGRRALAHLTQSLQAHPRPPAPAADRPGPSPLAADLTTPIGGIFLLWPALLESGYWPLWLEAVGESRARDYLCIVALKALGRGRSPLRLSDPGLAAFAGLSTPPIADARHPRPPDPWPTDQPLPAWVSALPDRAAQWYPERDRQVQEASLPSVQVLYDAAAQHWLGAWPTGDRPWWHQLGPWPPVSAAAIASLQAEAQHLQLGGLGYPWLHPRLDASLSAVTSFVLRRTAARLPGFPTISPMYLAQQFLAHPATLHPHPDGLTVHLSGGPLRVVLQLAHLPDALSLPWLDQPVRYRLS